MKYNCIMFCHTHSRSVLIGVIIKHTVPHSFILGRQWKHEDPRNLSPGFSSDRHSMQREMTRRRFHPLHSKHELFRWNSHCFVTCAPLDLAMHYPWCYIATRKILISNKHIAQTSACKFSVHKFQVALTPRPCGFPKISANQICMSPDLFLAKMDIERFGGNIISKNNRYEWGLEPQFTL